MKHFIFAILAALTLSTIVSCNEKTTEAIIEERVDTFATHYYNWQYLDCVPYITEGSVKYLKYFATNVTQEDIDLLKKAERDASIDVSDLRIQGDSLAFVTVKVSNVYAADTIGRPAHKYDSGTAEIKVVKQGNKWLVDFSQAPIRTAYQQQSESQDPVSSQD